MAGLRLYNKNGNRFADISGQYNVHKTESIEFEDEENIVSVNVETIEDVPVNITFLVYCARAAKAQ